MQGIKIYTTPNCSYCKEVREYFNSKNTKYEEIDMSRGGIKETIEMKKRFKRMGLKTYPIIIINHDVEGELIFSEFDKDVLNELIGEND